MDELSHKEGGSLVRTTELAVVNDGAIVEETDFEPLSEGHMLLVSEMLEEVDVEPLVEPPLPTPADLSATSR